MQPPIRKPPAEVSTTSSPNIATLVERFDEPLRARRRPESAAPMPPVAAPDQGFGEPEAPAQIAAPVPKTRSRLRLGGLVTTLTAIVLIPAALLAGLWWHDMLLPGGDEAAPDERSSAAQAEQGASALEVALTSPGRIQGDAGKAISFPIAIDATGPLPARSIVAVTALPEGATFSEGRPDGGGGWSVSPDEIGGLQLRLPAHTGLSDLNLELVAGDGRVLSQSKTQVSVVPPSVATVDAVGSIPSGTGMTAASAPAPAETEMAAASAPAPAEESASPDETSSVADVPSPVADMPPPERKPKAPAANGPDVAVKTVKVVTVKPPRSTKPYDGAYALGAPADEPDGEWMETKTAVDMHARAEQKSETVKVAQGGIKVRVVGRDKRWIQVTDPATSTTGWIYDRFLKPAEAPAQ